MRVENEGYEYRGYELGEKVMYTQHSFPPEVRTVIGFDECEEDVFIMLSGDNSEACDYVISHNLVVLQDTYDFEWAHVDEVKKLDSETLPQSISPVHAIDILEDEINQINYRHGIPEPHLQRILECIEIIKSTHEIAI